MFFDASFVPSYTEISSPILIFFETVKATQSNFRLKAKTHVERTKSFQKNTTKISDFLLIFS